MPSGIVNRDGYTVPGVMQGKCVPPHHDVRQGMVKTAVMNEMVSRYSERTDTRSTIALSARRQIYEEY